MLFSLADFPFPSPSFVLPAGILTVLLILYTMLRRFSTNLKHKKGDKDERREPKENGTAANGKRHSLVAPMRKSTTSPPVLEEEEPAGASREAVQATFEKYSQLIHASQTPIPRQVGDATFLEHDTTSGLFGDIKSLGFRDVGTLKDIIQDKAAGGLTDDKTYLMERIIQVCAHAIAFWLCRFAK